MRRTGRPSAVSAAKHGIHMTGHLTGLYMGQAELLEKIETKSFEIGLLRPFSRPGDYEKQNELAAELSTLMCQKIRVEKEIEAMIAEIRANEFLVFTLV